MVRTYSIVYLFRFLIDQLYDRNTSAGQKQLILSIISLSVRELGGWSNVCIYIFKKKKSVSNAGSM